MDPRVRTPRAGLEQQFALSMRLYAAIARVHDEIVRLERAPVAGAGTAGGDAPRPGPSADLRRLHGQLLGVYTTLQDADVAPSAAVVAAAESLLGRAAQM
jgi:hypothetical protein